MDDGMRLRAVPFKVTHPERIAAKRYYDPGFFELEREHLWPHVWQMACRLEEIPSLGDWVEYRILQKSVIIVRTQSGVKAFHNACRHRGMALAQGRGNCKNGGFVCPFHGWRYNMNGENIFVFGRQIFSEANLIQAELALAACRAELWAGCVFINFDDRAPSLQEGLGPMAARLNARNVDQLKVDAWVAAELPVNWKLAMEAFMEGYHTMRTHPQLQALVPPDVRFASQTPKAPTPQRQMTSRDYIHNLVRLLAKLRVGMNGLVTQEEVAVAESLKDIELPADVGAAFAVFFERFNDEVTKRGRDRGLPVFDLNQVAATHKYIGVEFVFPNFFLLPQYSAMSAYRIRPLGPESCLFEIWSLSFAPEGEARPRPEAPDPKPWDDPGFPEVARQDFSNLPPQQRGLHAGGFQFMRLSPSIEGLISNYQRLLDGYLAGIEPARLAAASGIVNSGFDAPILDIGI
jgi:phenylpropionate dioxygenase-like ring-hydroxylating dioxygenase large terminal subunit